MKKSLILGLLGLAASIVPSFGQGYVVLDNYNSTAHPLISYGAGVPANGVSGAPGSGAVNNAGFTVGLYFASGNVTGSVAADPTGTADPGTLGGGLALGTGAGATIALYTSSFNTPGQYQSGAPFQVTAGAAGGTFTVEIIAYSGASYANAAYRGHSSAFTITSQTATAIPPTALVGDFSSGFSILPVPEPTSFALSGLGAAALLFFRRKK